MKRKFTVIISAVVLVIAMVAMTSCGTSTSTIDSELYMADDVQSYLDNVDVDYAYDIAETMATDEEYLSNDLGYRTAGSDAEHKASEYLADEMESIGLTDVERTPVTVDKFQFNDASLTIKGTDIDIMPASYAESGTKKDGITAEIVDVGTGTAEEFDAADVKGKIALVGVDQWNESWIDSYIKEANNHGAVALVSYDAGGYGAADDDTINIQDVCCEDIMPTVSISKNQYGEISDAIKDGNNEATLKVDCDIEIGEGTTYNVTGKIKGKSSDQQIVVSGHYDMYFKAFQDDSSAVGLTLAMAKAMIDSGYTPENDIIFLETGAEEWGMSGSQYDWTVGAWEMINTAYPEWADKTLSLINFELCAFYDDVDQGYISCVPEFRALISNLVGDSGIIAEPVKSIYSDGISTESVDADCIEDGVSWRGAGVPYIVNVPGAQDSFLNTSDEDTVGWTREHYHTTTDTTDTYSEEVMMTNLNTYGAIAIYIDETPALELDLTATCDDLDNAISNKIDEKAGADVDAYKSAVKKLRSSAEDLDKQIADVNDRYAKAVADESSDKDLAAIRAEGQKLNKKSLSAFKDVQDNLMGLNGESVYVKHVAYQNNIKTLNGIVSALNNGELYADDEESGALDLAWQLNNNLDYGYYIFSPKTVESVNVMYDEEQNPDKMVFGTGGKGYTFTDVGDATVSLIEKSGDVEKGKDVDFSTEKSIYNNALTSQRQELASTMDSETAAINKLASKISK